MLRTELQQHVESLSYLARSNRVATLDGRFITFESYATNLVPGDTNGVRDVFLRDRQLRTTDRLSVSASDKQANGESYEPVISGGDGRFVAFSSSATNLVHGDTNTSDDVFVHRR